MNKPDIFITDKGDRQRLGPMIGAGRGAASKRRYGETGVARKRHATF
jgi:hypothetical protein